MYDCECLNCGKIINSSEHCKDIKCPSCGGDMRRVSRPGKGQPGNSTKKKSIQAILDDIFFNTSLEIIEGSSDRAKAILSKLGITLPNEDFALISGTYMLADEANKNTHRVAEEYIMAAVNTLIFKAANYFHDRSHPIGFYIDATYDKDTKKMKSCAIIWKSQFPKTYAKIVELIEKEDAGQSFELVFQDSVNNEDGTMDLIGICFKGGAFLPRSKAACESTDFIIEAKIMENLIVGRKQEEWVMSKLKELITIITKADTTEEDLTKAIDEIRELKDVTDTITYDEMKAILDAIWVRTRKVVTELKETADQNKTTVEEVTRLKEEVKSANEKLSTLKYSEDDVKKAVKEALEIDKKLKERRAEIEAKEDIKDADLLDDTKYENLKAQYELKKLKDEKAALEAKIVEKDTIINAAKEKLGNELPTGGDPNMTIAHAEASEDTVLEGMKRKTNKE